jgi:putative Mg2+ transporter-C (MgtC) family protein
MTGIGFLGGGAIMKDGLTVRGLTTAGSIWATASLGILVGIGFYFAAAMALIVVLATLTVVNWIETRLPSLYRGTLTVTFPGDKVPEESELRALLAGHGFRVDQCDYDLSRDRTRFAYKLAVTNRDPRRVAALTQTLRGRADVCEFSLSPTGD